MTDQVKLYKHQSAMPGAVSQHTALFPLFLSPFRKKKNLSRNVVVFYLRFALQRDPLLLYIFLLKHVLAEWHSQGEVSGFEVLHHSVFVRYGNTHKLKI